MLSAIVTGAASGIGRAVAFRLAAEGWAVVGVDRDGEALTSLIDEIRRGGAVAAAVAGDVAQRDAHREARHAARQLAPLGCWVGCAGITHTNELAHLDEAAARRLIDVNQFGLLWGVAEAVAEWTSNGSPGAVAVISSVHARHAYPQHAVYEMTKAAAEALIRNVAVTYGPQGIRAVAVAPGAVATPALEASLESAADPNAARRHLEHQSPAQRLACPEEIAAAVSFLVSDQASYISGTTLAVDGGWSAVLSREPQDARAVRPGVGQQQPGGPGTPRPSS
jgi:NAD(P)-dependent dehydrogenase (short-subunit alcohol dehydrogenase family)